MKHYSIIHPLYMAFYSKDLYRAVARDWSTGICMLYLLSLVALCWIPGVMRLDTDVTWYMENEMPKYVAQMPEIVIKNGEASIKESEPFLIKDKVTGDTVMIIDTTGKTKSLADSKATLLLTKKQVIMKDEISERAIINFSDLGELTFNRSLANDWIESFTEWFVFFIYPFAVIFAYVFRVLQVIIYALVGSLFSRLFNAGLDYRLILKVSCIAITPMVILNALTFFFRVELPASFVLNSLIATGYLIFGIRSALTPQQAEQ